MNVFRGWAGVAGAAALLAGASLARAEVTNAAPDFKEVYDLIRANLAGVSDADLNQAAVQGLIEQLHAKVALVSGPNDSTSVPEAPVAVQSAMYDGGIGRLRINGVVDGLAEKLAAAEKDLAATNTNALKGLILDLRFAGGTDYPAAVSAANLFIAKEMPLLDWGTGVVPSKANSDALTLPVIVLVNKQTSGSAEALAAILRADDHAVILGSPTAGETTVGKNFPLKDGRYLRIAMASVKLADGETLSSAGIKPDIRVSVKPDEEKVYFNDPYKDFAAATAGGPGTNTVGRISQRLSEADLIRERKERPGMDLEYMPLPDDETDAAGAAARIAKQKPVVHDPVLARALDLVKGISAFGSPHAP